MKEGIYKFAEPEKARDEKIKKYKTISGAEILLDTSPKACEKFGFQSGDRVRTTHGEATVIGVNKGNLWFHLDGDEGASYFGSDTKEAFERNGFRLLSHGKTPESFSAERSEPDLSPEVPIKDQEKARKEILTPIERDSESGIIFVLESELPYNEKGGPRVPEKNSFSHFTLDKKGSHAI